ncbi:unnamed protein product [Plutella xylostella]|uniref:UDP-glucose 4-epimerase n=1 Tax=Plutella xylostella TaxID=51655 RepID=A0A8S4FAC7_PLUXY|nr:unnamed protein product [Plutella xylostella]
MGTCTNGVMKQAILLTGGAGYVGSHTVAALLEDPVKSEQYDIVVIDNLVNAYRAPGQKKPEPLRIIEELTGKSVIFYDVNIADGAKLQEVFDKHSVHCVIHFAALKAVGESVEKPLEYYQNNITGTCTLLDTMRKNGVYNLIFSSSCTVYGDPERLPLDESHATGRGLSSPYARTKHYCETICEDLAVSDKKWSIISLRYFNPVGAHASGRIGEDPAGIPNNLMPYIAQVAVGRLPSLSVFGGDYPTPDGSGVRDYIHVADLAAGHARALALLPRPGFTAVNLGTGNGYSVLQMIAAFEKASGRKIPYKIVGRRAGDIAANYADVSLSHKLLGWSAKKTLDDMCADTWRWQSNNPNGFKKSS